MEPKNVNNKENTIKLEIKDKMPDEMTPEEQEVFLNEPITRKEAMNFIDGYMQNHVLPQLEQQISLPSVCLAGSLECISARSSGGTHQSPYLSFSMIPSFMYSSTTCPTHFFKAG